MGYTTLNSVHDGRCWKVTAVLSPTGLAEEGDSQAERLAAPSSPTKQRLYKGKTRRKLARFK